MNGRSVAMRGFTLIELMITLTVIAMIIGVGLPMYGSFTRESSLSGATSELIGSINEARSKAVSGREFIRLEAIDGDWSKGWKIVAMGKVADDSDDDLLFVVTRNDGGTVAIEEVSAVPRTSIVFDRDGRAQASQFEIGMAAPEVGDPGRVLTINAMGRVDLEKTTEPAP